MNSRSKQFQQSHGLIFVDASDVEMRSPPTIPANLDADSARIAAAIRRQWPRSEPEYHMQIFRRFTKIFNGIKPDEAVKAIDMGYSSPFAAMNARVIRRRRYMGFTKDSAR